jgi:hypothetical protein
MALSEHPAERHRQIGGLFTDRVLGACDWDAPSPVAGWAARDVVRHLTEWFPPVPLRRRRHPAARRAAGG